MMNAGYIHTSRRAESTDDAVVATCFYQREHSSECGNGRESKHSLEILTPRHVYLFILSLIESSQVVFAHVCLLMRVRGEAHPQHAGNLERGADLLLGGHSAVLCVWDKM